MNEHIIALMLEELGKLDTASCKCEIACSICVWGRQTNAGGYECLSEIFEDTLSTLLENGDCY